MLDFVLHIVCSPLLHETVLFDKFLYIFFVEASIEMKSIYSQLSLMVTECWTGFDMLLFEAWHVSSSPLSVLSRSFSSTDEVTVEPDDTSEVTSWLRGRPL